MELTTQQEEIRQEVESAVNQCITDSRLFERKTVKKTTAVKSLSSQEWAKLREGVTSYIEVLRGKSIVEWVAFLNASRIKCNSDLLRGLCSDLHQWRESQPQKENASGE